MGESGEKDPNALIAALAETVVDLGATITPAMLARIATDPTQYARPLPFAGLQTARLPRIGVRLAGPSEDGSDLVVDAVLAEGGMGRVFLARQRSLAREVAIKTVKDDFDPGQVDALLWEGAIAGHLDHPGVTPIHMIGHSAEDKPILVMKRITGRRWSDLIHGGDEVWARFPTLAKDRMRAHVDILMEIARTVHFAHGRGVVHLDIKPDNVMIGELGEVYLVDWGVATTLSAPARLGFVGTPAFVAPEVVAGTEVGPWTDVYLLGATLHLLLTGEPRHRGSSLPEVVTSALASEPIAYGADVPHDLAALANAATARERGARPKDALAFHAALAEHLEHTASIALARDGAKRLDEVTAAPEVSGKVRLAAEARFAFRTALDRWAGNAPARDGLRRCLETAIGLELERENLPAAKELASELDGVPSALSERMAKLEAALAARAASEAELARLHADADLSTGSRERQLLVLTLLVAGGVGISIISFALGPMLMMNALVIIAPLLLGIVVVGAVMVIFRKRILGNTAARRLMQMFTSALFLIAVHRSTSTFLTLDPIASEVRSELLLLAGVCIAIGVFVSPRAFLVGLAPIVGVGAVLVWQHQASTIFNVVGALTLLAMLLPLGQKRAPVKSA